MSRALISHSPLPGDEPLGTIDMSTDLGGVDLPSPVLTASGCAAAGRELDQFFDITAIGAIVTKSVMLQPRSGRATPRMAETPSGMLNSIGLQGPGIDTFIEHDLAWLADRGARTIVSIAGGTVDEYAKLAARLRIARGVSAIEVNISCPNVENRGQVFACDAGIGGRRHPGGQAPQRPAHADLRQAVARRHRHRLHRRVRGAGRCHGRVRHQHPARHGDQPRHDAAPSRRHHGRAVRARRSDRSPCAACGRSGRPSPTCRSSAWAASAPGLDALEFVLAGANAVSIGTVVFHDPSAPMRIHEELQRALVERGFGSLSEAVSYAHRPADPIAEVDDDLDFISE